MFISMLLIYLLYGRLPLIMYAVSATIFDGVRAIGRKHE